MNDECNCLLCKPVPGKRGHPQYGYDLDAVAGEVCVVCRELIGKGPYVHSLTFERFGSMGFLHVGCADKRSINQDRRKTKEGLMFRVEDLPKKMQKGLAPVP
jgi:hypothetical protein